MLVLVADDWPEVANQDTQEPLHPELDVLVAVSVQFRQHGTQCIYKCPVSGMTFVIKLLVVDTVACDDSCLTRR